MQVCINEKQKVKLLRMAQAIKASATFSLERQLSFTQHSNSLVLVTDQSYKEKNENKLTGQCSPVWICTPRCSAARCRSALLLLDLLKPKCKFII